VVPGIGTRLVEWIWGGFAVGGPTLTRLYSLHYLFPFLIAGVVVLHIWALHIPGNNNPSGIDVKSPRETIPFHPYYTIKDGFALALFALFFACFVFYAPNVLGHPENYIPANPLQTPAHIVPEWYFLPFYAILRSIPNKLGGVLDMACAIFVLFILPWLDTSRVRSATYRPLFKQFFWVFVLDCLTLGYIGSQEPVGGWILAGRICTAYYFIHFLIIVPLLGWVERTKPLPPSIADAVLAKRGGGGVPATATAAPERRG
jgi:quinol-cytochrome oxidoreductase complex cytochrome b subunit